MAKSIKVTFGVGKKLYLKFVFPVVYEYLKYT